jgi:hypothetical protein
MLNKQNSFKKEELNTLLKNRKKIDVNQLRNYKGFENIEENDAKNVIETLSVLAELLLTINLNDYEQ